MTLDILIPSYFRGEVLWELLTSINNYPNTKTYVCFDSLDDPNIVETPHKFPWVTFLKKENGGLSDTRNFLAKHSKGDYLFFVDDDDLITDDFKNWITKELPTLSDNVYKFESSTFNPNTGERVDNVKYDHSGKFLSKRDRYNSGVCTWVIKKQFYDDNMLSFQKGVLGEDILFMANLIDIIDNMKIRINVRHIRATWYRVDEKDKNKITNNWAKNFEKFYPLFNLLLTDNASDDRICIAYIFWKHYMSQSVNSLTETQKQQMLEVAKKLLNFRWRMFRHFAINRKFQRYKHILLNKYFVSK